MDSQPSRFSTIFSKKNLFKIAKILILVLVVLSLNRVLQSYLGQAAFDETGLPELSLSEALETAQSSNRLVLADMSAIWCPSCRKLDKEVLSQADVKEVINQSYVFTRIEYDSDEGEAFMEKYHVSGFPTLLVLNENGDKLVQLPLTFDPQRFKNLLNQASYQFK